MIQEGKTGSQEKKAHEREGLCGADSISYEEVMVPWVGRKRTAKVRVLRPLESMMNKVGIVAST